MHQKQQLLNKDEENEQSNNQSYTKAINSMRQVTQIRKITHQSLSPIIKKIQDHISHILSQSTALRQQTGILQQVQATNLEYKRQIDTMKQRMNHLQKELIDMSQQLITQQKQNDKKVLTITSTQQDMRKDVKEKTQKLKKLTQLNQSQTYLLEQTKYSIIDNFNRLRDQLSSFYSNEIKQNHKNEEKFHKIQLQIQAHNKIIKMLEKDVQSSKEITTLYSSERDQIRSYIRQSIDLTNFAIKREQYEKDKKVNRIENEMTKNHIQKILNQALTPQIRKYLPSLRSNAELLINLQKKIQQCNDQILSSKQTENNIQQKILKLEYSTKKEIQEKQIQLKKLSMLLDTKLTSLNQKFLLKQAQNQQKIQFIRSQMTNNKQQADNMFDTFIQKNKTKIYLAVVQSKPPEVKEQEERIKAQLLGFQQKMAQINKTANQRNDNLLVLTGSLESKLEMFQNRITKARSDLKVENDNIKKIIESFNVKLQDSETKMQQQSKIISKLLQICILNTSLQIDEEYFQIMNSKYGEETDQTYISFHDGVIFEANGDTGKNEAIYRKKKLNKEILKRTILKEEAKLIDFITVKLKNWKWQDPKERPSHFFIQSIFPSYEEMATEKKVLLEARKSLQEKNPQIGNRMSSANRFSYKKSQSSFGRKGSTARFEISPSKNISKRSIEERMVQNTFIEPIKPSVSFKQSISHELTPNSDLYTTMEFQRPNRIKLKKIDQNTKNEKEYSRNRYSSSKKTIQ